jgi:uncharacterized protein (DUF1330 family)
MIDRGGLAMKTNHKLVLAVLVGILIGVAGAKTIHAQQEKAPPGYVISEADAILDIPAVQKYGQGVPETLAAFNHHFIVRGGKPQSLDGGEAPKGVVVIAFDRVEKAREWYDSPAYQAIKPLRQSSTKGRMFIVEGVTP